MNLKRIAAFADNAQGGNPAGVLISDELPEDNEMRRIAAEVGYSETAFAMPLGDSWRVRYFSPESEVPFCGHATIALGAALALTPRGAVPTPGRDRFPLGSIGPHDPPKTPRSAVASTCCRWRCARPVGR